MTSQRPLLVSETNVRSVPEVASKNYRLLAISSCRFSLLLPPGKST